MSHSILHIIESTDSHLCRLEQSTLLHELIWRVRAEIYFAGNLVHNRLNL